ncbi:FadR family transcriptional regulator [Chitinophaga horti]|uniref:FadR family transcriptional regulator n=1 Tax=Chitinophaga horti TaxID=2920382 RepID=A0ABY6J889_9BACT|nr:FadR/GntR family transcriptional regulator [Chitinophaga horti]UYQ94496.1 FadR family transcriptional regulator [Chitinophaga horti]
MIVKKSLADEVAARLQEQISLGQYKPGEKLPIEPELMKAFGVGRSTVREAIRILVNTGLLRVQQGAGTFVDASTGNKEPISQRLRRANAAELDEVRQLVELKIAEKAALHHTPEHLAVMKAALRDRKAAARAGEKEACVDADIAFHVAIAEAAGNQVLADLYKTVSVHLREWFLQTHGDTSSFIETQPLHEQLLKHITDGEAKKAWNTASKIISWH